MHLKTRHINVALACGFLLFTVLPFPLTAQLSSLLHLELNHFQESGSASKLEPINFEVMTSPSLPDLPVVLCNYNEKMSSPVLTYKRRHPAFKTSFGTKGFPAFEVNFFLTKRFNIGIGYSHLKYNIQQFESNFNVSDYYASIDAAINLSNINAMLEYKPGKGKFRLVAGLAWAPKNTLSGRGQLRDGFKFNDIVFTPEELGYIGGAIQYKWKLNPYAGIGFGRSHPKKRLGFTFDLGFFYKGKPQLSLEASNLVRHNVENLEKLQKIADDYQWWPVIDFGVKYRIL